MWDLPKAMLSFSWATSLFGLQQITNLQTPLAAADAMDRITRVLEQECGAPAPRRETVANGPTPTGAASAAMDSPSAEFSFDPHFIDVLGSRMHYVEQGVGAPILLLHGNPTWSYIWRNIIPYLSSIGRCIAPDLIGYGRSDKPDIEYRWRDHVRYLEAFIARMGLRDIMLVLHDQGSTLGFHYAMRHPDNVRAIAFFEAIVRPYPWEKFSSPEFREIFRRFRSGGIGGEGWRLLVDENMFIEVLLPQASGRPLSHREMDCYREPFRNPASRVPIWRFARETPIGGEPPEVWEAVEAYSRWLQQSTMPKLLLYATPGALLTREHVDWCRDYIRNLDVIHIGEGTHFLQEGSPDAIGHEIATWCRPPDRGRLA
jgi:haloalkane dehalogenase